MVRFAVKSGEQPRQECNRLVRIATCDAEAEDTAIHRRLKYQSIAVIFVPLIAYLFATGDEVEGLGRENSNYLATSLSNHLLLVEPCKHFILSLHRLTRSKIARCKRREIVMHVT